MYEDKDIEKILLVKLITMPDQYVIHHANITENMFVHPTNINIFNSYKKLVSQGKSPDLVNLSKDLNKKLSEAAKQNKQIAELLSKTDIVKNSIADPKRVEGSINEKAKKLFDSIKSITTRPSTK